MTTAMVLPASSRLVTGLAVWRVWGEKVGIAVGFRESRPKTNYDERKYPRFSGR